MVTWENYEEYLLLHVDGELNDAEQRALLGFIALHPEVEDELKTYQSAVLTSDAAVVYERKEALLKPVPAAKTIVLGQWWRYGVAAGVVLIVSVFALRWMSANNGGEVKTIPVATVSLPESKTTPNTVKQAATTDAVQPLPSISHARKSTSIARNSVHSSTDPVAKEVAPEKMELETINPITNEIAGEVTPAPVELLPVAVNKAMTEPSAAQEKSDAKLLAWLPEEKREGLELLKENVDQKMGKANQIRENIKDTQLALKFGNRELVVINF
jgi:hypothetical protein